MARLQTLQQFRDKIFEKSPRVVQNYREKLNARLQELMIEDQIDEERLALEVALFADKCNIDEELVRVKQSFSTVCTKSGGGYCSRQEVRFSSSGNQQGSKYDWFKG